jgi:hypothetical protein
MEAHKAAARTDSVVVHAFKTDALAIRMSAATLPLEHGNLWFACCMRLLGDFIGRFEHRKHRQSLVESAEWLPVRCQ